MNKSVNDRISVYMKAIRNSEHGGMPYGLTYRHNEFFCDSIHLPADTSVPDEIAYAAIETYLRAKIEGKYSTIVREFCGNDCRSGARFVAEARHWDRVRGDDHEDEDDNRIIAIAKLACRVLGVVDPESIKP